MATLIEFLEKMGSDAHLRGASREDLALAMEAAGIDVAARDTLLSQDQGEIEELMGADANVFCSLETPDDGEEGPDTPPPDDGSNPKLRAPKKKRKNSKKKRGSKKAPKKPAPKKKSPGKGSKKKKKSSKKKSSKKKKVSKKKTSRRKK